MASYWKQTLKLRLLGWLKIPMLAFIRPSVVELTAEKVVVRVPLIRRTSNHLGSMYFGALAAGADCAGGLIAWTLIEQSGEPIQLIFKEFKAVYFKRAEADVHFTCTQGAAIRELVERTRQSGERENLAVRVVATCPTLSNEPVAEFELALSLKKRAPKS